MKNSEEAEQVWKYFLSRDFQISSTNSRDYRKSLKVSSHRPSENTPSDNNPNNSTSNGIDNMAMSIFGFRARESIVLCDSAYESWVQWHIAKRRYYEGCQDMNERMMNAICKFNRIIIDLLFLFLYSFFFSISKYGPLFFYQDFLRAAEMWSKIESWCFQPKNFEFGRELLKSLNNGVSYTKGRFYDSNEPGIHAFGAIFAFYNGQRGLINTSEYQNEEFLCRGLFGGYFVYGDAVFMHLSPNNPAGQTETKLRKSISYNVCNSLARYVHLNCTNGHIYLSKTKLSGNDTITPNETIPLSKSSQNDVFDAGLVWMECLTQKLAGDEIEVGSCVPQDGSFKTIVHYPTVRCCNQLHNGMPIVSRAVTNGIEVVASSYYDPLWENEKISYSIRMRILTHGEDGYLTEEERGYTCCQLISRHWIIFDGKTGTEESVDGYGVVGIYPQLHENYHRPDQEMDEGIMKGKVVSVGTFRYQSNVSPSCASFRGRIKFVPGSIEAPTGNPFYVDLAPFALVLESEINF